MFHIHILFETCLSKEKVNWSLPETETTPCYWLTNDWEEDRARMPTYLWSSLQRLRLDLEQRSRPTPQKMRKEQDQREEGNDRVVAELQKCADFWNLFGGPPLEHLRRPTAAIMEAAEETVAAQKRWLLEAGGRRIEEGGLSPEQQDENRQLVSFAEDGLRRLVLSETSARRRDPSSLKSS